MKGLAVMDMDGTLLEDQTVKVLCKRFGLMEELRNIDRRAEFLDAYEVSRAVALLFSGLSAEEMERVFGNMAIVDGAEDFVHFLKSNDFVTAIITDSYTFLASSLAKKLRIDVVRGNELEIIDGVVTGRISMPLGWEKHEGCQKKAVCKLHEMLELTREYSIDESETLAVGDSKTDLCMIKNANIGIAFRPKDPEIVPVAEIVVYTDFFELVEKLKEFKPEWWKKDDSD